MKRLLFIVSFFLFVGLCSDLFAEVPSDLMFLKNNGATLKMNLIDYYYSPSTNLFYLTKYQSVLSFAGPTSYIAETREFNDSEIDSDIYPELCSLATQYGYTSGGSQRSADIGGGDSGGGNSPSVELDQNFQMDFSRVFIDVGKNIAKNLTFSQGLMLSIFAIVYVWSVITGTPVKNQEKKNPVKVLTYDERTDQLHRNIDKSLKRWGWSRGYSVNQIKRNPALMEQYYNETYM